MAKSKIAALTEILKGTAYLATDEGLGAYQAALKARNALMRKDPQHRLSGVREALNRHRVTSWLDDAGKIEFRKDGKAVLTL